MKKKVKEIMIISFCGLLGFALSFFSFDGIYFVASIPWLLIFMSYKREYFISSLLGVFIASFVIDYQVAPLIVLATLILSYLSMLVLRKFKLSVRNFLSITGGIAGVILSGVYYISKIDAPIINICLLPVLSYVLCLNSVNIQYDMKLKEDFSLTKKQVSFVSFLANLFLPFLVTPFIDFKIGLVAVTGINYIFTRIDPLVGIVGIATSFILSAYYSSSHTLFLLIPLIFALKPVARNKYYRSILYLFIGVIASFYLKEYGYLIEVSLISIALFIAPNSVINIIHKYILEPQDYELRLYQKSYYKCLNRNKKIQKVMEILEGQMKNNPNMKKASKDILFKNMQFLSDKLKEEDNIRLKEQINRDLLYHKLEILEFRMYCDYFYNYNVILQIRDNNAINEDELIKVFQEHLGVRLRISKKRKNQLLNVIGYEIINDDLLMINLSIKQRSKEAASCGDSYVKFDTKNKKYFMVSDGMGHGFKASKESKTALLLLKDFIELGMKASDAILSCNALLFDKESEKFNTLDLVEYDMFDRKIYLYKNGSGSTYLKNGKVVKKITSSNLPLGIVENIQTEKLEIDIDNEFVILTSDGIKSDLTEFLENNTIKSSKVLVEEIFQHEGDVVEDDQTIVVINVIKNY